MSEARSKDTVIATFPVDLRDWFAGQAMAGWLASYGQEVMHPAIIEGGCDDVARDAYQIADAMLKAREGQA